MQSTANTSAQTPKECPSDTKGPTGLCSSAEQRLLTDDVLEYLRRDDNLAALAEALRAGERLVADRLKTLDESQMHLFCRRDIFFPLEEEGVEPPAATLSPEEFAQAIYDLPRQPRTANLRRLVRESARVYAQLCSRNLPIPVQPEGFHDLWECAMVGEPRWSENSPSSAFRPTAARILSGKSMAIVLQQCVDPADYDEELSRLLAFLRDETILPEIRAASGFALFEWIHPFLDGNGHVGRMLALTLLQEAYSLPTMVCFSQTLAWGRGRTSRLFAPLRNGEGTLVDFCRGTLEQLLSEQEYALRMLEED